MEETRSKPRPRLYARGGPKSKDMATSRTAPLKQTKLTTLASPVKAVAQSVNDRRRHRPSVKQQAPPQETGSSSESDALPRGHRSDATSTQTPTSSDADGPPLPKKAKRVAQQTAVKKKSKRKAVEILSSDSDRASNSLQAVAKPTLKQTRIDKGVGKQPHSTKDNAAPRTKRSKMTQSTIQLSSKRRRSPSRDSEEEAFRNTKLGPSNRDRARHQDVHNPDSDTEHAPIAASSSHKKHKPLTILVEEEDSEDELITPARRRQRFMPVPHNDDDDMKDEPGPSTKSSKKGHAKIKGKAVDMDAYEDEEASDFDLDKRKLATKSTSRGRNNKKTQYRSALEKLKRRKAGLPSDSDVSESDGYAQDGAAAETDDDRQSLGSFEVSGDEEVETYNPRTGFEEVTADVPAQYMQPRTPLELFKICCQWDVLDLILPQGGVQPDRYFKTAIDWLRDRTAAKADIARSSIWKRIFMRALQHGPDLVAIETGNLGYYCDACGRSNRIATYVVRFEGSRYDHVTLEDLDANADSSEDDLHVDADRLEDPVAENKRRERIMRQEFNLGVNCFERTEVVHELFHLRKHLRTEIYDKLVEWGYFTVVKKYERSIMTHEERIEQANQLTEELDTRKVMARWWSKYKGIIEQGENFIVDPSVGKRRGKYVFG